MSLLDSLRQNTLKLFLDQNRLASGYRLNAPSEDPVLGAQVTNLSEILERQEQVLSNIDHADTFMAATDAAIGEVNDLLMQAHSIAAEMVNSHADSAQRQSMAELIDGIIDQLVMVGNRTYSGVYLLGGQRTTEIPFTQTTGGIEYLGDDGKLTAHVDVFQDPQINLTGNDVFGVLSGQVNGYVDLDPAVTVDTRLADLDGTTGSGVSVTGAIRISLDSPETLFTVDLSGADTVGDVIDLINAAAEEAGLTVGEGNQFNASINDTATGFQLTVGGGTVTVEDPSGSVTARDLGIAGTGAPSVVGADVQPRLTPMTTVASLFGGSGATLGTIQIQNGTLSDTVDLSDAETVQDILNRLNTAGVHIKAQINEAGTGIDIANVVSGTGLHIGEDGGDTADLLGIRTYHGQTELDALNNGRGVDIREDHDDLIITAKDGSSFTVNLDGSTTIQDVIDKINEAAAAASPVVAVTASLATTGNGIRLVDATGGTGDLSVGRADMSAAIDGLGLEKTTSGTELISDDVSGVEPASVFSALIRLHEALVTGGPGVEQRITQAAEVIQHFMDETNTIQGVIGARSKAMTTRLQLTEDAVLATQRLLSDVRDLDYTEAVTQFQQAQTTLQANLMTGSRLLQLSLLNFL